MNEIQNKLCEVWPTLEQVLDMVTEITGWDTQLTLYLTSPSKERYVATRNIKGDLVLEHESIFLEEGVKLPSKKVQLTLVKKE